MLIMWAFSLSVPREITVLLCKHRQTHRTNTHNIQDIHTQHLPQTHHHHHNTTDLHKTERQKQTDTDKTHAPLLLYSFSKWCFLFRVYVGVLFLLGSPETPCWSSESCAAPTDVFVFLSWINDPLAQVWNKSLPWCMPLLPNRTDNDNQVSFSPRDFSSWCRKLTIGQCFVPSPSCTCPTCNFHKPWPEKRRIVPIVPSQNRRFFHISQETHSVALKNKANTMAKSRSQQHGIQKRCFHHGKIAREKWYRNHSRNRRVGAISRTTAFWSPLWTGPQLVHTWHPLPK